MNNIKIWLIAVALAVACICLTSCVLPGEFVDEGIAPTARFDVTVDDLTVGFDGSGSFGAGDNIIVSWDWYFGDGAIKEGTKKSHTYDDYGTYHVLLIVTDENGDTGRVERDIKIEGDLVFDPVVIFSFIPTGEIQTGSVVLFNGSNSTAVGDNIYKCRWDFGDGKFKVGWWAETNTITHTYDEVATYTVIFTVWTSGGKVKSTWKNVEISP